MGQAKQRGTPEQRLAQAFEARKEYQERPIKEVIKELELPEDSQFLGYVIHNHSKDDYLFEISADGAARKYCASPEGAVIYEKYDDAVAIALRINQGLKIGRLFDVGKSYAVAFDEML